MQKQTQKISGDVSSNHPKYYKWAVFFAALSLSIAFSTKIFAQDTAFTVTDPNTGTSTTPTEPVSCSYSYSAWSECSPDGKKQRAITGMSPDGCVQDSSPDLIDSCSYQAPQCDYAYSDWGACQSNGTQRRGLKSESPLGCKEYTQPVLERVCTYVQPVTESATTSDTNTTSKATTEVEAPQCVYTYSDWGACREDGKRVRNFISKSPDGCVEYTKPVVGQSCVYDGGISSNSGEDDQEQQTNDGAVVNTTSISTSSGSGGDVTPEFSFSNVKDGMNISGNFEIKGLVSGAQSVEYYLALAGSNTNKYIGTANYVSGSGWSLRFNSKDFPNGEFYLRVKVKNAYGTYGGGQKKIFINNGAAAIISQSDFEQSGDDDNPEVVAVLNKFEEELGITDDSQDKQASGDGQKNENVSQKREKIFTFCQDNPSKCFPERDSDKDGLSDIDEIRFGTDLNSADSDLDGFIDGDEVKNGFDPLKHSSGDKSDKVVFENPKESGEIKLDTYVVEDIALVDKGEEKKKLKLSGRALPNSFVTIYIFSDPIILTVKTDSDGNWVYELDKDLENGDHSAYVAVTDNTGRITAKSKPFLFVKTAQAVTSIPEAEASTRDEIDSPVKNRFQKDLFFLFSIAVASIAIALAAIGLIKHHRHIAKDANGIHLNQ